MTEFYPPEATALSREVLDEVLAAAPEAVLIGGWGSWVRTRGPMSHDIDMILGRNQLAVIEGLVDDLSDSRHLAGRKWRGTWRGVHLDLYVPFESKLGQRLALRTEVLIEHTEVVEGYRVLTVDAHIATKLAALLDRPATLPGFKDREEIRALLADGGGRGTPAILTESSERLAMELVELTAEAFGHLAKAAPPAVLSRQERARLSAASRQWETEIAGPSGIEV